MNEEAVRSQPGIPSWKYIRAMIRASIRSLQTFSHRGAWEIGNSSDKTFSKSIEPHKPENRHHSAWNESI